MTRKRILIILILLLPLYVFVGYEVYLFLLPYLPEPDPIILEDKPDGLPPVPIIEERPKHAGPNIILIVVDTLRGDHLNAAGYFETLTPEIDQMVRGGVQFANCVAPSSWTRPSFAGLLTGIYPRSMGLYKEQAQILPSSVVTLPETLQRAGYLTYGLNTNPNINTVFNFRQGFDKYLDSTTVWSWMIDGDRYQTVNSTDALPHSAPELFKRAIDFAKEQVHEPTFLFFNFLEVHEWGTVIPARREYKDLFPHPDQAVQGYKQLTRQISRDIGSFVREITKVPGWEDALFVLTSDHGEGLDSHPNVLNSTRHGPIIYRSQFQVPLIFYRPGWEHQGVLVEKQVRLIDLMPTLLDYVGIDPLREMDGTSLVPLFSDPQAPVKIPEFTVAETYFRFNNKVAVVSNDWTYIENRMPHKDLGPVELQHAARFANGMITSVHDRFPHVVDRMKTWLKSWEKEHPKQPPTRQDVEPSEQEIEQLKAIGYMQGD